MFGQSLLNAVLVLLLLPPLITRGIRTYALKEKFDKHECFRLFNRTVVHTKEGKKKEQLTPLVPQALANVHLLMLPRSCRIISSPLNDFHANYAAIRREHEPYATTEDAVSGNRRLLDCSRLSVHLVRVNHVTVGKNRVHFAIARLYQNRLHVRLLSLEEFHNATREPFDFESGLLFHASPVLKGRPARDDVKYFRMFTHMRNIYLLGKNTTAYTLVKFSLSWTDDTMAPQRLRVYPSGYYIIPSRKIPPHATANVFALHGGNTFLEFRYGTSCKIYRISILSIVESRYEADDEDVDYEEVDEGCENVAGMNTIFRADNITVLQPSDISLGHKCYSFRKFSIFNRLNRTMPFEEQYEVHERTPFAINAFAYHRRSSSPYSIMHHPRSELHRPHIRFGRVLIVVAAFLLSSLALKMLLFRSKRLLRHTVEAVLGALTDSDDVLGGDGEDSRSLTLDVSYSKREEKHAAEQQEARRILASSDEVDVGLLVDGAASSNHDYDPTDFAQSRTPNTPITPNPPKTPNPPNTPNTPNPPKTPNTRSPLEHK